MLKRLLPPLLLIALLLVCGAAASARLLDAGTLGSIALALAVFGLLAVAAVLRRARERAAEAGVTIIGPIPFPDSALQHHGHAALELLLQERAVLRAEMLAAGIELGPDGQDLQGLTSRA